MHVNRSPTHAKSWQKFTDQQDSKKKRRTFPLNIISVMCKKRSKSERKYLETGCIAYKLDLSFCRMLLIVYFVTSKFRLLNVNEFNKFHFVKRKSQILVYKSLDKNYNIFQTMRFNHTMINLIDQYKVSDIYISHNKCLGHMLITKLL